MIVDIFAFIPFDFLNLYSDDTINASEMYKLAKIPRIYKFIQIFKVVKYLKSNKNNGVIVKIQDLFSIQNSKLRLALALITIVICTHIVACLWYFTAVLSNFEPKT